jgi:DNA topoisomerase II
MKGRNSKQELTDEMARKGFATTKVLGEVRKNNALHKRKINVMDQEQKEHETEAESPFDYLLNMPLSSLTVEKINSLNQDAEKREIEMKNAKETSSFDLWRADLDALMDQL